MREDPHRIPHYCVLLVQISMLRTTFKMSGPTLISATIDALVHGLWPIRGRYQTAENGLVYGHSTPRSDPAYITSLRRQAYENGLNTGSLLFFAPAVSQAAACDGTRITTTTTSQETARGTLPTF